MDVTTKTTTTTSTTTTVTYPKGVISITDATTYFNNWKSDPVKSFPSLLGIQFKLEEIGEVLFTPGGYDLRCFFGINNGIPCLLVVSVDGAGNNLIDYENEQYIYCFTESCGRLNVNSNPTTPTKLPPDVLPKPMVVNYLYNLGSNPINNSLNSFFIRNKDISQIAGAGGNFSLRGYFGFGRGQYHMMFVGVDKNGTDRVDYSKDQYVYDFTQPCPPMCSNNSRSLIG